MSMSFCRTAISSEPHRGTNRRSLLGLVLLAGCLLPTAAARAGALDAPKAEGLIGERIDGYLGVVDPNAPADVRKLVDQVNAEREARYAEIAKKRAVPTKAVALIAGEKVVGEAPSGQYVMGKDGRWQKKP
jgi:uncharacterized protein YdbL (DUF1318 family)